MKGAKSPLRVQSTRIFKLFLKFKNTHSVAKRLFRHADSDNKWGVFYDTEAGFGLCHAICDGKAADLQRQKASLPELKWLRKSGSFDSPFQFAFCRTTWYRQHRTIWITAITDASRQSERACRLRSTDSKPFRLLE